MFGTTTTSFVALALILIFHSSSSLSTYKALKASKCVDTPRPVNKSIKACWDYTRNLATTLVDKAGVKTDVCIDPSSSQDSHDLGVELMRTSKTIFCYGIVHGITISELTSDINGMWTSISEIIEDPNICVLDGDYKSVHCPDLALSDLDVMYLTIAEQAHILEGLFINMHDS
ncbi:hypothetical protein ACHWQZ_G000695 [Mnemiopsis leidyi]